jgi:hypothetical protein
MRTDQEPVASSSTTAGIEDYDVLWSGARERLGLVPGLSHDGLPSQLASPVLIIERREVPASEWHFVAGSGTDAYRAGTRNRRTRHAR